MRIINIPVLFVFLSLTIVAQAQDSTSVWNIRRSITAMQDYELSTSSGFFLLQSPIRKSSFSVLQYEAFGGDFKLAQQGKKNSRVSFESEGIRSIKKLKLWGSFTYNFEQNDSIRFSHRVDNTDPAPFYYGSQKAVHYSRTNYQIKTLVTHPVIGRLSAGLGMDYGMGDHFSTNDPRAALKHFRLVLKPELIYTQPGFALGLNGTYGYGQNEYQVDYRNKEYYESASYPEYLNYLVNGYGIIRDALDFSDRVFLINRKWKGGGVQTQAKLGRGTLKASASYLLREEDFERGNSSGQYASRENYGAFNLHQWEGMLKYIDPSWAASLNWKKAKGKEYNTRLGGNNYLYHTEGLDFSLTNTQLLAKKKLEFGLLLSARNTNQVDGNYEIQRDRSLAGAGLLLGKEWMKNAKGNVITRFSASHYFPFQTDFKHNATKLNSFITQVILPDAAMDEQQFTTLSATAQYMRRVKTINWQFALQGKYLLANKAPELANAFYLPGNTAYMVNASVALFF